MKEDGPSPDRFRILVCIDGSDESYRGLKYAVKLGGGVDADIVMLYVRPIDQGLRSGGLQVRVARENMLDWGLELPGIQVLKKGWEMLREIEHFEDDWTTETVHTDVAGDPLGDNKIDYTNKLGRKVVLKLKVADDIATGILEQWEIGEYDLIILGAPEEKRGLARALIDPPIAEKVAMNASCSVLVARGLEVGHGHLICTDGTERSLEMVSKDAMLASRCNCAISLISVTADVEGEAEAKTYLNDARSVIEEFEVEIEDMLSPVGDPVEEIIEAGANYSVIVVSESSRSGMERLLVGSVAKRVLRKAHNSVLVVR
ncbi:MAG: universal stress protein [Alphaproteobacteria bacterium]|jgi:nucleotide-binding universal stress UspA family protein|nr:universal stress protein [Alphaproteobacteria bacterium]MBT4086833.1 universal stress protein [Alphaproteobacteria bacterium]MBT4544218.1 universal stress protein [Alphaproteobacteria bacterium]